MEYCYWFIFYTRNPLEYYYWFIGLSVHEGFLEFAPVTKNLRSGYGTCIRLWLWLYMAMHASPREQGQRDVSMVKSYFSMNLALLARKNPEIYFWLAWDA